MDGQEDPTIVDLLAAIDRNPVPKIPLFSELDPVAFRAVADSLRVCRFRPGQTVVREGDDASSMFAIVSGSVDIERIDHGMNVRLATIGPGDFFGEMGLISEAPRIATVRAREESALFEVMRARIGQITAKYPNVGRVLDEFYRRRLVANVLRSNPMLQPLFRRSFDVLMSGLRSRAVRAKTVLLREGDKGTGFYILLRGECAVTVGGHEIARLREGDVFGEISLLLNRPITATVTTTRPSFVLRVAKNAFDAAVAAAPEVGHALAALGESRLEETSRPAYNV